jgi:undecaprenyl-diphosphatase
MRLRKEGYSGPGSRPVVRHTDDLVLAVLALVALVVLSASVHRNSISGIERDLFKAVNAHTVLPYFVVWAGMQFGNLFVIPVVAAAATVARRPRLGASLLVAGAAMYFASKWVKSRIKRGRPPALIGDVVIRGAAPHGLGFVSGHAAVATALALVAWPWFGRRGKTIVVAGAVFVAFARVYVGAHLPLDVVGGAALGASAAGLVRFIFGRPTPVRTLRPTRAAQ